MTTSSNLWDKGSYAGDILLCSESSTITASITSFRAEELNRSWHAHVNPMLCYVLNGYITEKKKSVYDCPSGKLLYHAAGEYHQTVDSLPEATYVNLEIEPGFLKNNLFSEQALASAAGLTTETKILMVRIAKELYQNDSDTGNSIELLLLHLLSREPNHYNRFPPVWLDQIKQRLNDQWNETVSLEELSAIAGVHPVTISKKFHHHFGCSLGEYRRRLKVERALSLIGGHINLTELAYACGFFDQSHFTRTFKELTGFLPHNFQKIKVANSVLF